MTAPRGPARPSTSRSGRPRRGTPRGAGAAALLVVALLGTACGDGGAATVRATTVDAPGVASEDGDGTAGRRAAAAQAPAGSALAEGVDQLFVRVEFDAITDEQLVALRGLDGVTGVTALRADDVALFGSTRSDGTVVDDLPATFKISVAAVVDDAELGLGLDTGEVVMTTAGTRFRDLDVGASVRLDDGFTGTVVDVVDREDLQRFELVLAAADATRLDVRPRQRATVALAPDADVATVVAAVERVLGDNGIVLPRSAADGALVLSLPETKRLFGEFAFADLPGRDIQQGVSFVDAHIVTRDVPFFGRITCHEAIFEPLIAALQQIRDDGLGDEIVPSQYAGCWAPRRINRNANLSRHSWGIGIDINVDMSQPGGGPIPSPGVIAAFEQHGFAWGGDYPIPDNHHFEYVGAPAG